MPKKLDNWMPRLMNAVESANVLPFQYGTHDCCLWAAYCVDSMCGTKIVHAIKERFNYADESAANAILEDSGGLLTLIGEFLGPHTHGVWAAPGDVVLVRNGDQVLTGISVGHAILAPSKEGLLSLSHADAVVCWKFD